MNPEDIVKIILISAAATVAAIAAIEYYIRTQEKQGIVTPPDPEPKNPVPTPEPEPDIIEQITTFLEDYPKTVTILSSVIIYIILKNKGFSNFYRFLIAGLAGSLIGKQEFLLQIAIFVMEHPLQSVVLLMGSLI